MKIRQEQVGISFGDIKRIAIVKMEQEQYQQQNGNTNSKSSKKKKKQRKHSFDSMYSLGKFWPS